MGSVGGAFFGLLPSRALLSNDGHIMIDMVAACLMREEQGLEMNMQCKLKEQNYDLCGSQFTT